MCVEAQYGPSRPAMGPECWLEGLEKTIRVHWPILKVIQPRVSGLVWVSLVGRTDSRDGIELK
jgi:hypothetical protein